MVRHPIKALIFTPMNPIANILFDFGNVIIDIDSAGAFERIAAFRSQDMNEETYRTQIIHLAEKFEVDAISKDDFISGILDLTSPDTRAEDVVDAWNSMLVGIPKYRFGMLESLKQNFNLLLLSNTNQLHIAWVHEHLESTHGIDDFESRFFHDVYYSHMIKARKPDPAAFLHVIESSYITPAKTLFIDDVQEYLDAAGKLGFQTMLSPPQEEIAETLKILGYY
jgi:glucose-1-phosphatase